jgi:RNA polymerase sigma-70 factor (ECF subfamily)
MAKSIDDVKAQDLLAKVARGDEQAFTKLHRLMAQRVYAFSLLRLRNADHAESVVVDTMLQVWRSAAKFRRESQVSTWIFGIARLKVFEHLRAIGPDHEDIADYEEDLVSDLEDGEAAVSRWQHQRIVRDCLEELTAAHRECLQLVHYEGLPLAEVAMAQGVPENTVKTRLFHARKNMRVCVEREGVCM